MEEKKSDVNVILDFITETKENDLKQNTNKPSGQIGRIVQNVKLQKSPNEKTMPMDVASYQIEAKRRELFGKVSQSFVKAEDNIPISETSVKSSIKEEIAKALGLTKNDFEMDGKVFQDYGIKADSFYHIFLVLDIAENIDRKLVEAMMVRLIYAKYFKSKQKIVLYSIIRNTMTVFETEIEKDIVDFFRR